MGIGLHRRTLGWALVRRQTVVWTLLAAAVVVLGGVTGGYLLSSHNAPSPRRETVVSVARGTVIASSSAAGTVTAGTTRGLGFSMSGTVTTITVKPGDSVTAGELLATIDSSSAQQSVTAAVEQLSVATQALSQAESATRPTASCPATAPASSHPASPQPSQHQSPSTGPSPSTDPSPSVDPGPGHLATASPPAGCGSTGSTGGGRSSAGGIFAAEEQVNNAELALTQAQQRLAGTTIIAPSAGVVMSVAGVVGGTESPGGTGFIGLGDVSGTEVTAEFSEAGVANLAVGQAATIVLPDRSGQAYPGRVSEIDLAATTSGRLVRYGVRLAFDQVPTGLLYGESADVQVVTAHAVGVLYVPASAVSLPASGGQAATVTVRVNGRDVVRAVQIGLRGDRYTEIPSGLALGDQVVLTGGS